MDQSIQTFVDGKRMALVGASRKGGKMGNMVLKELKERGYSISLVHPEAESIDGEKCYPDLQALAGQVDGVVVNVPPERCSPRRQRRRSHYSIQAGGSPGEMPKTGTTQMYTNAVTKATVMRLSRNPAFAI